MIPLLATDKVEKAVNIGDVSVRPTRQLDRSGPHGVLTEARFFTQGLRSCAGASLSFIFLRGTISVLTTLHQPLHALRLPAC